MVNFLVWMAGRRKEMVAVVGWIRFGNCHSETEAYEYDLVYWNEVNGLLFLFFAKALFSAWPIFLESSELLAKGSSSYSAIVAHPAGKRSAIFINLFLFDNLETIAFKASPVDSWRFWSSRMSSISSSSPALNLNCKELPLQQAANLPHLGVSFWG